METIEAAAKFGALAQGTRIEALRVLAARGANGMTAGELARALGQAPSTLSFHLSALEQAGFVTPTRRGRQINYAVRFTGLRALLDYLAEACGTYRGDFGADRAPLNGDDGSASRSVQPAFNVLFICTRNSARSIMAEAILERIGGGRFRPYSAGSEPARRPLPEVITRLKTLGHEVGGLRSKSWHEFTGPHAPRMDFVLTLCDPRLGQDCPEFGARTLTAAWPFPDPAKFKGPEVERSTNFHAIYGMIRRRLETFIALPYASLDRTALKKRLDELGDITRYA